MRGFSDCERRRQRRARGVTEQLDYLEWLGVDCLWLLPFYESPLRDGGLRHLRLLHACCPSTGPSTTPPSSSRGATAAGIRVIADMVMNHTSDQHPWFRSRARTAPIPRPTGTSGATTTNGGATPGSSSSTPSRPTGRGTPHREQYYWHRFFHHQPDLNYDNPEVAEAMLDVVRYWLNLGLDGFRLDAVPYLFERDGTNGENLPETHAFLKRVRADGRRRVRRPDAAGRGEPVARRTWSTTSATATSAT